MRSARALRALVAARPLLAPHGAAADAGAHSAGLLRALSTAALQRQRPHAASSPAGASRAASNDASAAMSHMPPPPVDTHELVKRLERSGMSQAQAEELTSHICEVVAGTLERLEAKFATKTEAERTTFLQETAFSMFKASIQTDLEHQKTAMKRDCDAVRTECDKLRTELRYEIDKIQASQRLDLNLEKGRIRDELLTQNSKSIQTEIRLDKEINSMRTTLEANKNDIIRFCVGAVASTTAVGLGILRLVL